MRVVASPASRPDSSLTRLADAVVGGTAHAHRALVASASFVLGFVALAPRAVPASLVGRFFPAVAEWSLASAPLDWIASARSATDTRLEVGVRARRRMQGRRCT